MATEVTPHNDGPKRSVSQTVGAANFTNTVAQVTLAFWIIKICATTFGERVGKKNEL